MKPNTVPAAGEAMPKVAAIASTPIQIPARTEYPGDLMDRALDKLRTIHLAISPDNKGWVDESALFAAWSTLEAAVKELEPVRNHLQEVTADEAAAELATAAPRPPSKQRASSATADDATAQRFDVMTLEDLRTLFDGVQAAHQIMMTSEWSTNGTALTGSYLWFKVEAERLANLMQEIAEAALYRQPADEDEEWEREQILVRAKPHRSGRRRSYTTTTIVEVLS